MPAIANAIVKFVVALQSTATASLAVHNFGCEDSSS